MVGLSHLPMRRLLRGYTPEGAKLLWPTEMLNSRRLPNELVGKTLETLRDTQEEGLVPQILGNEECFIHASVKKLLDWGACGIDINMGCPVQKALRHNYGVALMGDPDYARKVVGMTVKASHLPVSVKLRSGHERDMDFLVRFIEGLIEEGAAWLTIHPRLASEGRRGKARWEELRQLRRVIRVPLIGNGDVQTSEDVLTMLEGTHCDMVMVGRALTARPWLLWQIGEDFGWPAPVGRVGERAPRTAREEGAESERALNYLLIQFRELYPEALGVRRFQFFIRTSMPWLTFGQSLLGPINSSRSYDHLQMALDHFFSFDQEMMLKTDLRS
jgi:tRNA-dihydrouridine synthase